MTDSTGGGRVLMNGELLGGPIVRSSGGGPKTHPRTSAEAREILTPQIQQVRGAIAALPETLRTGKVVIEADVWANYLANSYYPSRLLTALRIAPLGSKMITGVSSLPSTGDTEAPSKSYLLAVDDADLAAIEGLFADTGGDKTRQGAVDELRQFNAIRLAAPRSAPADQESGDLSPFEAVLHPDPVATSARARIPAGADVLTKFTALVQSVGGVVHEEFNERIDGLTFVALDLPAEQVDAVAAFNPLRSITPSPAIVLAATDASDVSGVVDEAVAPASPSAPEVLVFDGGIDASERLFAASTTAINLTGRTASTDSQRHGSAVTAAILYGDLADGRTAAAPAAHVTHFQILPTPDRDAQEYAWILRQIREEVLARKPEIVNLSLGPKVATEDGEPHRWTAVLDKLAHEHGILFVSAAGNNGERDQRAGFHRVQVPGDMVNGLCVGAADAPATDDTWAAAAYSGRGPGRAGARVQPSVLAFGGTKDRKFGRVRGDGSIVHDDFGTSYAAPLVTHVVAQLRTQLAAASDAPTLRALIAHGADPIGDEDIHRAGHGRLTSDAAEILQCGPGEAMVIYQGLIARDEVLGFLIPVPANLGSGKYDVKWTLAFATATDSAEAGEYTNAGLEATFRPHSERFDFRRKDPTTRKQVTKTRNLQHDADEIQQLLAAGWRPSVHPSPRPLKTETADEKTRREQGKWESLWCASDTLKGTSLNEPRIDISHVSREGGRITADTEDIEFTLVVTIGSRSGVPVYAEIENDARWSVLTELPVVSVKQSVTANIDVTTDVEAEIGGAP
ncbi:S8 family peptidase [Curtobacterium herbarum]|uniref:S8 family peptidase n=1 Tax=Curtobacterium herbarum TaxID=150122 RepID=UPI001C8E7B75|nr:S8 family peptidase [Curtobacterium herbarum]MBY0175482.1 S8 family peptidase [Curtobacterium herbarum]